MRVDNTWGIAAAVVFVFLGNGASTSAGQSTQQELLPARALDVDNVLPAADEAPDVADAGVIIITAERLQEVEHWTRAFAAWQERTEAEKSGQRLPLWSVLAGPAKQPEPPAWLPDACELLATERQFAQACELLTTSRADPRVTAAHQVATQREVETKSIWWEHLHLDGLWSTTQSNSAAFGLFGTHVTVKVAGRVQVFIAPGLLLVSVPTPYGARQLWPATDWGVSYRLFNLGRTTIHLNLAKVWMLGSEPDIVNQTMTLAGFSVSFRPSYR